MELIIIYALILFYIRFYFADKYVEKEIDTEFINRRLLIKIFFNVLNRNKYQWGTKNIRILNKTMEKYNVNVEKLFFISFFVNLPPTKKLTTKEAMFLLRKNQNKTENRND